MITTQNNQIENIMTTTLSKIKNMIDVNTVIGSPINTPSGVTVIPVSRVTMGFASGGIDLAAKSGMKDRTGGGGGGTGVSITPVAFLTIGRDADIKLIPINEGGSVDKIASVLEKAPEIINGIKGAIQ